MDREASMHNILEDMLLDANVEPTNLPVSLLKSITNNFSDDQQIGSGGFAVVYRGQLENGTVAVKKLSQTLEVHEVKFNQEVDSLMRVKHKNIVRFLGYCSDTQGKVWKHAGKNVMAEVRQRLLCFEFLPNGSLDKYISDASGGLEWGTRYQIIKGVCEGVHYLHQQKIVHLDLKPANILLDHYMVPKIADFGLSKCFDEKQSRAITSNIYGSRGYLAPEFYGGVITFKSDIYSLGIIIIEILTGQKGYHEIENVLQSWSTRFGTSQEKTLLEYVRACAKIGIKCTNFNPAERPVIEHIIEMLEEIENTYGCVKTELSTSSATHASSSASTNQLIQLDPPELRFRDAQEVSRTLELIQVDRPELRFPADAREVSCTVKVTNITDHHVAFCMWSMNQTAHYNALPNKEVLSPRSTLQVVVTRVAHERGTANLGVKEVVFVLSTAVVEGLRSTDVDYDMFDHRKTGRSVQQVDMDVVFLASEIISHVRSLTTLDVHPTKPWIMMSQGDYHVHIWNYETREAKPIAIKGREVTSAKFIPCKNWIMVGCSSGLIYLYSYDPVKRYPVEKIRVLQRHSKPVTSFAVHATEPYVLSVSRDGKILIWDYGRWELMKTYHAKSPVEHATFNPKDTNTFATAQDKTVKIWDLHSDDCKLVLSGHSGLVVCLDYFSLGNKVYLITGSEDKTAKIWDCQTGSCIQTLEGHREVVKTACCHPDLLKLITGSWDGSVHLWEWDTITFRYEGTLNFDLGKVNGITTLKGSTRIAIGNEKGLVIVDIDLEHKKNDGEDSTIDIMGF